jgi:hypothetical protein
VGRAVRRHPAVSLLAAAVIAAIAGGSAAVLASSGGTPHTGGGAVAAAATSTAGTSTTSAAAAPAPGVITVDVEGAPLLPQILAIATQVLAAARARDSTALDNLLGGEGHQTSTALNQVLARPGVYAQIVTLLTKTHAVGEDGFQAWPGFLLGENGFSRAAADLKFLGIASPQEYKGISITIGDSYAAKPYVPALQNINLY